MIIEIDGQRFELTWRVRFRDVGTVEVANGELPHGQVIGEAVQLAKKHHPTVTEFIVEEMANVRIPIGSVLYGICGICGGKLNSRGKCGKCSMK